MSNRMIRTVNTDVLVIGGGGAGVTAAVAAARGGAQVLLVSKGQAGNSGNTIMIGGSYAMDGESAYNEFHIEGADPGFTKKDLYDSIMIDGFYLSDQNMVEQFVEESPAIVYEVAQWAEKAGRPFTFNPPAQWFMSGNMMGGALKYGLSNTPGITVQEDVMITDLLKNGDTVCGAVGVHVYTGELWQYSAKAVVLGTGGFQPFSLKNTNSDMTGDGLAMAYRAGAQLSDLEFFLFLMSALEPNSMKGSILPFLIVSTPGFKYRAVDAQGTELSMPPELKALEATSEVCKLLHIVYYGQAICDPDRCSPSGGVWLETLNTDEELDRVIQNFNKTFNGFYKEGYYHGEPLKDAFDILKKTRRWEVGLVNEYTVGGIFVDEKMRTTVSGLFAGGECASGVFGAERCADAVTEMVVQGYRAGQTAAEFAASVSALAPDNTNAVITAATEVLAQRGSLKVTDAIRRMEAISDAGLNCYRDDAGLTKAIAGYEALEREFASIGLKSQTLSYNYEWIQYMQLKNRLLCSRLAAVMAKARKESRGLHMRTDYPDVDNKNFLVRQFVEDKNGVPALSARPPIAGAFSLDDLPDSIPYEQYLLESDLGLENMVKDDSLLT